MLSRSSCNVGFPIDKSMSGVSSQFEIVLEQLIVNASTTQSIKILIITYLFGHKKRATEYTVTL